MTSRLPLAILAQPDDESCGPTCLHAIYSYWEKESLSLDEVLGEVLRVETGGTLAVHLGSHALRRGYRSILYTNDLQMFDPTWFPVPVGKHRDVDPVFLTGKLLRQVANRRSQKFRSATEGYTRFLASGGKIRFRDFTPDLIRKYLDRGIPILTGLSATYLYNTMREIPESNQSDDLKGRPCGHFVVLRGYDRIRRKVLIADPYARNPRYNEPYYAVNMRRLIHAVLLGVLTFDANLLVLIPEKESEVLIS
ncbi:C39 family peptidase [Desulfobotulus sp. H1]|uniref:C39 family peptidase n=1 Tax=Desulfobotulus pelophilus TaxID=2823377 RepID=A0ABT3N6C7_9BACT|nr:C39 family peptidase [Desulfobotulus pelophilus]MCW7753018.1 C39 family peptidase [Desulfobotulus pelophilus]